MEFDIERLSREMGGKYVLCMLAARRARDITDGAPKSSEMQGDKAAICVLNEIEGEVILPLLEEHRTELIEKDVEDILKG